jgi:hypothetical protein
MVSIGKLAGAQADYYLEEGVGYLERSAAAVRRGHAGAIVEQAPGLIAAAFRHRASRAGDPQLHTHVLVANLGRGLDGCWLAPDGRQLYAHARAASFIYQAVLRSELTQELGVEWTPVREGLAEVVGVPRALMRAFSRRRAEIEAALKERGTSGPRAAEAAALATRRAKDRRVRPDDLIKEWNLRAAALGFGHEELSRIVGRARAHREPLAWDNMFAALAGPHGLTQRASTFSRRDVLLAICEALPPGTPIDARRLERAAEQFLRSERVVALLPGTETRLNAECYRRRDGRVMPVGLHQLRYTTPEMLALERRLIERATGSHQVGAGVVRERHLERALRARPTLSDEQRDAVRQLCVGGDRVAVIAGRAGTGKTYALTAAREAWQAEHQPVLGVAVARRAAVELRDGAGIESTSIAALLAGVQHAPLPDRCVLVVDEAGMASTRQLAELFDHVLGAEGKLVLVGDRRQLPEIEAGGVFHALVARGLAIELRNNLRQVNVWERRALEHIREGRPEPALELYASHGRLLVEPDETTARERLVADWWAGRGPGDAVMIARLCVDVADLNSRARERMREAGALGGPELELPGSGFVAGDHVVVKRNDSRAGVSNGERARVLQVDPTARSIVVRCRGRSVRLDEEFLQGLTAAGDPTLVHGYAITGQVAQGLTVDRAFVLATKGMSREWAYVGLSRGRESNKLYVAASPEEPRLEFAPDEQGAHGPI